MGKADRLGAVENTLAALVEAVNTAGDDEAQRKAAILAAIGSLGERVDELAKAVQVVMAARTGQESGGEGRRT